MVFAGGAAGGATAAAMHTSSYRVKFKRREFLELIEIAKPDIIYNVGRIHFFAFDGFVMYSFEGETEYFKQKGITVLEAVEFSNTQWAE
ncbi:MAG: hypothetical protein BAJATHORv1_10660 [Candidatus Thorarchaeota archaeon]|nr:MAG: hypothetical protein BAJATHORv1_10660 [Candidatus Thorarchaeota archaeon]